MQLNFSPLFLDLYFDLFFTGTTSLTLTPALKVVAREKIDCINQQLEVSPHYKFTPDHLCELTPVLKKFCP